MRRLPLIGKSWAAAFSDSEGRRLRENTKIEAAPSNRMAIREISPIRSIFVSPRCGRRETGLAFAGSGRENSSSGEADCGVIFSVEALVPGGVSCFSIGVATGSSTSVGSSLGRSSISNSGWASSQFSSSSKSLSGFAWPPGVSARGIFSGGLLTLSRTVSGRGGSSDTGVGAGRGPGAELAGLASLPVPRCRNVPSRRFFGFLGRLLPRLIWQFEIILERPQIQLRRVLGQIAQGRAVAGWKG